MALEAGLVSPQTLVDSKSPMRYGRFTIRDFHNYGARLTVEDVLVKSSNIGAAHIGMILGATRQQDFFKRVGLFDASPVELVEAGRTAPLLPPPLDRPLHHHHLLRPRHGGDAAAPRRRLRHASSTAACASTRASSRATRARPRPTG